MIQTLLVFWSLLQVAPQDKQVRMIVAGLKADVQTTQGELAWDQELKRIWGIVLMHKNWAPVDPSRPTIVLMPEMWGLIRIAVKNQNSWWLDPAPFGKAPGAFAGWLLKTIEKRVEEASWETKLKLLVASLWLQGNKEKLEKVAMAEAIWNAAKTFRGDIQKLAIGTNCYVAAGTWSSDQSFQIGEPSIEPVYNVCFFISPAWENTLLSWSRKVFLVPDEKKLLAAGSLAQVPVHSIGGVKVGIGICYDVFQKEFIQKMEEKGCNVILQLSANPGKWGGNGSSGAWQPQEWYFSVFGSIQGKIRYNACSMMTGNLLDFLFDGQSSITDRNGGNPSDAFVGSPPPSAMGLSGGFLQKSPWVMEGGMDQQPQMMERANLMAPGSGSPYENSYLETFLHHDVTVTP